MNDFPAVRDMVGRLQASAGKALGAVVLYGPAAHGDVYDDRELNLLVVLSDLELSTLDRISDPVKHWVKRGYPMPRLFSPRLIAQAADVFPIEFLEISSHRVVLFGDDPFTELDVNREHLRTQCERELREKMMRLREAYLETGGKDKLLRRLLSQSYVTFAEIFRGCLILLGVETPTHNREVVAALAGRLDIDPAAFDSVEALLRGEKSPTSTSKLFDDYYRALDRVVQAVDRLDTQETQV